MSDLKLDVDQASELKAAFRRGNWTNAEIKWACQGNFLSDVRGVVLRQAKILPIEEVPNSSYGDYGYINVDRSIRPVYPEGADQERVYAPDFIVMEGTGPKAFFLNKLKKFQLPEQRNAGGVDGNKVYRHLEANRMLKGCLGFPELLAIMEASMPDFISSFIRKYLGAGRFFGWRSVINMVSAPEDFFVPCFEITTGDGEDPDPVIAWHSVLHSSFGKEDFALRF